MIRIVFLLLMLAAVRLPYAYGQLGVVWHAPDAERYAVSDLVEMRMLGLRNVRTGPITAPGLLAAADSMGIVLYRGIGLERLSPRTWADTLTAALRMVDALAASPYPGWIGLGSWTATNLEATCEHIDVLARRVRAAGHRAYYVTPFTGQDRCAGVVDAVLVDALGRADPEALLTAYREQHPGVVTGLASAAFSERMLARSRNDMVFLHRWRDQPMLDPWMKLHGLYDAEGNPRPVVQMLLAAHRTGQPIFAREPEVEAQRVPWSVLIGWLLITFMAMLYATSPRFRQMIPRYFLAHGFYRNAVREAREVLPLTSTALVSLIGLSTGLVAAVVLHGLHDRPIGWYVYDFLPDGAAAGASAVMNAPFVLVILLGSLILLSMALWMSMWIVLSGRRHPLLASQALMLAVWPRWQAFALVPVAMVLGASSSAGTGVLIGTGLLLAVALVWSAVRTAGDMSRVSRIGRPVAGLMVLLSPDVLLVMAAVVLAAAYSAQARMIWDLLSVG